MAEVRVHPVVAICDTLLCLGMFIILIMGSVCLSQEDNSMCGSHQGALAMTIIGGLFIGIHVGIVLFFATLALVIGIVAAFQ